MELYSSSQFDRRENFLDWNVLVLGLKLLIQYYNLWFAGHDPIFQLFIQRPILAI